MSETPRAICDDCRHCKVTILSRTFACLAAGQPESHRHPITGDPCCCTDGDHAEEFSTWQAQSCEEKNPNGDCEDFELADNPGAYERALRAWALSPFPLMGVSDPCD